MNIPTHRFLLLTAILAFGTLPVAAADPLLAPVLGEGCGTYGTLIVVGSNYVCSSSSDCQNYGVQVLVDSEYRCVGGDCPNDGIRVSLGSNVCGDDGTYVCVGDTCSPDPTTPYTSSA